MPAYRYVVSGRVQGVGSRYFLMRQADALGVSGYARNRSDGSVEVVAEADDTVLADFEARLREGPSFAEVTNVEREPIASRGPGGFDIR